MRHAARWGLGVVLAAALVGCGNDRKADDAPAEETPPVEKPAEPVSDENERKALALLRDFVEKGGDVNETLSETTLLREPAMDVTRLHVAAESGWLSVVRYLVEHGAHVRAVAPSKSHYNDLTPLDVARHAGHTRVAALLERAIEGRALVSRASAPASTAGDRQAVRDTARAFVLASRQGDLEAAAALCTSKAAESLLPAEAEGEHQPAISEYDVRDVQVTGEQAVADVWVRNEGFPEGEDEFSLVLTLRRVEGAWRIDDLELEPHWEPEDLGPEVDR